MTYDPVSHDVVLVGGARIAGARLVADRLLVGPGRRAPARSGSSGSTTTCIPPAMRSQPIAPLPVTRTATLAARRSSRPAAASPTPPNAATWLWNGSDWSKARGLDAGGRLRRAGTSRPIPCPGRALLLAAAAAHRRSRTRRSRSPRSRARVQTTVTNGATAQPGCPCRTRRPSHSWTWTGHAVEGDQAAAERRRSVDMFGSPVIDGRGHRHSSRSSGVTSWPSRHAGAPCPTCTAGTPDAVDGRRLLHRHASASGTAPPGSRHQAYHEWSAALQAASSSATRRHTATLR